MKPSQLSCVLLLAFALAGCSRDDRSPAASAPPPMPVARLAADAQLPPPAELDQERQQQLLQAVLGDPADMPEQPPVMTPLSAIQLASGRAVLVVNSAPAEPSPATYGVLNVYTLKRNGAGWEVLERHEGLAEMGSNGQVGTVKWAMLAPDKPGFMVSTGGIRHGNWQTRAVFFDLASDMRQLGGFRQAGGNDCTPDNGQCWEVESTIRFVDSETKADYRDIVVDFTDKRYTVLETADGSLLRRPENSIVKRARYHYDGKEYVMKSGSNPVPEI